MSLYKKLTQSTYKSLIEKHRKNYFIDFPSFDTLVNKVKGVPEPTHGGVNIPIHLTSTFKQNSPGKLFSEFDYSRGGNPTVQAYEDLIARMEQGKHGIAFSSGMAAINAVLMTFNKDDHILSIDDVYGGTNRLMNKILKRFGL